MEAHTPQKNTQTGTHPTEAHTQAQPLTKHTLTQTNTHTHTHTSYRLMEPLRLLMETLAGHSSGVRMMAHSLLLLIVDGLVKLSGNCFLPLTDILISLCHVYEGTMGVPS